MTTRRRGVRTPVQRIFALTRRLVGWILLLVVAFYTFCAFGLAYVRFLPPPITAIEIQRWIEADAAPAAIGRSRFVHLDKVSPHLTHAVVVAEDSRFFVHRGVDWQALRQAAQDNWQRKRLWRGGSTITQQLVKTLFLGTRGGALRKIVDLPLALLAELILPKNRILELYLNVVEWGPGVYGAESASRYHYGVSAVSLDRDRAARLAACLPAPRTRTPQRMDRFSAVIRRRMAAMGW